jgi:hypothetical protein
MNEGCPKVLECIKETERLQSTLLNDMARVGVLEGTQLYPNTNMC